jgi:competence protein ComEA
MKQLARMLAMLMVAGTAWAGVDINTASQSELEVVKGLGPAKAKAIIDYREKNGGFKSLEELDNVKGFGKSSVGKLRGELTVTEAKSSAKAAAAGNKK